ncbi:MAG: hypothetical protein GC191_08135 [Azospirillum sp.]|nr:hypothetical protein [Azospirillum sp.]
MKAVKLLAGYKANNAGEVCGFPDQEAASLVAAGAAVFVGAAPQTVGRPGASQKPGKGGPPDDKAKPPGSGADAPPPGVNVVGP